MTGSMSVNQLIVMYLITTVVKILNMGKPAFFNEILEWESSSRLGENRLKVRGTRFDITRESYVPKAMRVFNQLPEQVRTGIRLKTF